jgi:hypothetical protein
VIDDTLCNLCGTIQSDAAPPLSPFLRDEVCMTYVYVLLLGVGCG